MKYKNTEELRRDKAFQKAYDIAQAEFINTGNEGKLRDALAKACKVFDAKTLEITNTNYTKVKDLETAQTVEEPSAIVYYTELHRMQIIHTEKPKQYSFEIGEELFAYENYVEVSSKPTLREAKLILSKCVGGTLCGRGTTENL